MWLSDEWKDYEVIDTSSGEKLERWGKYILVRPDPQVIWSTPKNHPLWRKYDAKYSRSNTGGGKWSNLHLPEQWQVRYKELTFNVKPMNFKHTGVFPEQAANWDFAMEKIRGAGRPISVLNLFAYTGGRGPSGEIWKLEDNLYPFVELVSKVLSDDPLFVIINSYTTGLAPSVLGYILDTLVSKKYGGKTRCDELGLPVTNTGLALPCGSTGRWTRD